MTSGIYEIGNRENGHKYIGSSANIEKRWRLHIRLLERNKHHCRHLQNAWNKYGKDLFVFSIIELCSVENLFDREQFFLDTTSPEYNVSPSARTRRGTKASPETRIKLSLSHTGKELTQKQKDNILILASKWKGSKHTLESKQKMSKAMKGKYIGRKMSDEIREKISLSLKGRKLSVETLERMSIAQKGKIISPEHRARISESNVRRGIKFRKEKELECNTESQKN